MGKNIIIIIRIIMGKYMGHFGTFFCFGKKNEQNRIFRENGGNFLELWWRFFFGKQSTRNFKNMVRSPFFCNVQFQKKTKNWQRHITPSICMWNLTTPENGSPQRAKERYSAQNLQENLWENRGSLSLFFVCTAQCIWVKILPLRIFTNWCPGGCSPPHGGLTLADKIMFFMGVPNMSFQGSRQQTM